MSDTHDDDREKQLALVTEVFGRLTVKLRADPSRRPSLRRAAEQVCALDTAAVVKGQKPSSVGELVDRALDLLAAPGVASTPDDPFPSEGSPPPEIPGPFEQVLLDHPAPGTRAGATDLDSTFSELLPVELGTITEPAEDPTGEHPTAEAEATSDEPSLPVRRRSPALAFLAVIAGAVVVAAAAYLYVQRESVFDEPPLVAVDQSSGTRSPAPPSVQPATTPTPEASPQPTPDLSSAPPAVAAATPTSPPTQPPATATPIPAPSPVPSSVRPTPTARIAPAATVPPIPATPIPPEVRARFRQTQAAPMVSPDWQGRPPAYVIHFSSYHQRANAELDASRIASELGRPAFVAMVDLGEEGVWHRVIVGGFTSEDEALAVREDLAERQTPGLGHVYHVTGPQ